MVAANKRFTIKDEHNSTKIATQIPKTVIKRHISEMLSQEEVNKLTATAKQYMVHLEQSVYDRTNENNLLKQEIDKRLKAYEERVDGLLQVIQASQIPAIKDIAHVYEKQISKYSQSVEDLISKIGLNQSTTPIQVTTQSELNSAQPTFSGKREEEVLAWIHTTKTNLDISKIDPNDFVTNASAYLRGAAQQDFISFKGVKQNPTWAEFVDNLKARFLPANYQQHLLKKIHDLKCTGSLEDHIEKTNT
jgi:hypothetical protein